MSILTDLLLAIYVIVCVLLVLSVLMQRPKSEGLGTAFGSGFTENILGAGASDFLVKVTTYFGAFFFILSFVLAYMFAHQTTGVTPVERTLLSAPMPTASAAPASTTTPEAESQKSSTTEAPQNSAAPSAASAAPSAPQSPNP
jgi:preprotein translocase subunit SecG